MNKPSDYTQVMVFHQALCKGCDNVIMMPQMIRLFTDQSELEKFALDAHNAIVRDKKILCVNPKLTILFGHALELTSGLPKV